jgi:hypothetical protein
MPDVPPVTNATLPANVPLFILYFFLHLVILVSRKPHNALNFNCAAIRH